MATIIKTFIVTGESHIDFREQSVTITLGTGSITGKHSKKIILLQFLAQKKRQQQQQQQQQKKNK